MPKLGKMRAILLFMKVLNQKFYKNKALLYRKLVCNTSNNKKKNMKMIILKMKVGKFKQKPTFNKL